jgi:hypothetical protein
MTTATTHLVTRLDVDTPEPFDDVRNRFESLVPTIDFAELTALTETGDPARIRDFTAEHARHAFVNFWTFDPTPVMRLSGHTARAITYMIGNPVLAETMFRHDPAVMLYAPLRLEIHEDTDGRVHLSIDLPSSKFASFGQAGITDTGALLDDKLAELLRLMQLPVPAALQNGRG